MISEATKKAGWRPSSKQLERMRLRELGKKHSEETRRKQSLNQIGLRLGWKHSEETKNKLSKILKESKPIKIGGISYNVLNILRNKNMSTEELNRELFKNKNNKLRLTISNLKRCKKIIKIENKFFPKYAITQEGINSFNMAK